jgi:Co/Zn/Cd efflux system component
VYALVLALLDFRGPRRKEAESRSRADPAVLAAAVAAVLFAVHPLQTQAVTYIWQRTTSLAALFSLAALLLHVRAARVWCERPRRARGALAGAIGCGILAMHTKESAFALPFLVALIELTVLADVPAARARRLLPWLAIATVIPLEVWLLGDPAAEHLRELGTLSPYAYFATQTHVLWEYLRLVLVPIGQNLDHDAVHRTTFLAAGTLVRLAGLAAIAVAAWRARRRAPVASCGALFFFLAQAPESSFLPLADPMFEHRVYLPLAGVGLVAAAAIAAWIERAARRVGRPAPRLVAAGGLLAIVVVALSCATLARNEVWRSPVSLWEDSARKSPGKLRVLDHLGSALLDAGDPARAAVVFERALTVAEDDARILYKLGVCYGELARDAEAERMLRRALEVGPGEVMAALNLGVLLARTGRLAEAAGVLELAVGRHPKDRRLHDVFLRVRADLVGEVRASRGPVETIDSPP